MNDLGCRAGHFELSYVSQILISCVCRTNIKGICF